MFEQGDVAHLAGGKVEELDGRPRLRLAIDEGNALVGGRPVIEANLLEN